MSHSSFLESARNNNLCFFGYRIPLEKPVYGCCKFSDCIRGFGKGFVIKPFDKNGQILTIPFGENMEYDNTYIPSGETFPNYETAESYYRKHASILIELLNSQKESKIVYSRIKKLSVKNLNLDCCFEELQRLYPTAYVFCFHTPLTGTWIGASPELLGACNQYSFSTLALAGTKSTIKGGPWSKKNKHEQQLVADFIYDQLKEAGFLQIITTSGQRIAGPVKHLFTEFYARVPENYDVDSLILSLSPTPALSGFPREWALNKIEKHESHSRGCYGGFCGPRYDRNEFVYWVNLRSMQINNNEVALYIGGGLMAESNVDAEWLETEQKADTLLRVLNNLH